MKTIFCLIQILIILFCQSTSAKNRFSKDTPTISPWELGFSSGGSIFITSLNTESNAVNKRINYWNNDINPSIGLFIVKNISPSLGVEINWLNTRLTGQWSNKWPSLPISIGRENPLKYNTQINQFDLMMVVNLDQIMLPGDEEDRGHFFIKTGIGLTNMKDTKKFYPGINYNRISYALGVGYSVSLNTKIKLQIGSIFRTVNTDNLDGVHVVAQAKNGQMVSFMKIFEIYNYSYLSVSYSLGNFGSGKYRNTYKRRR